MHLLCKVYFFAGYLLTLKLIHASPVEQQYETEAGKSETTIMMNIDGQSVSVVLPVGDVPQNLPQTIHTRPRDERINEDSMVILPSTGQEESNLLRDGPTPGNTSSATPSQPQIPPPPPPPASNASVPANPPAPPPSPSNPVPPPPPQIPSSNPPSAAPSAPSTAPAAPTPTPSIPAPPAPAPSAPAPAAPAPAAPAPPPSIPNPPSNTPSAPPVPNPQSPTPNPAPNPPPASPPTTPRPPASITQKPAQGTMILASAWMPMFGVPFFTNDLFGPIYPVYTQRPAVIQYMASPTVYYMQVIHIVYNLVPPNTIPLSSIMDLSLAITNILRSNAESLSSVVVDEPDGPNLLPELLNENGNSGFRSSNALDLPTPKDVTTQIQNAVQTYAEPVPEDVQNELSKALSENMAELLKPLYQNIAYTRKLRFEDNGDKQLYRRDYRNIRRRSPQGPTTAVIAAPPAAVVVAPPPPPAGTPPVVAGSPPPAAGTPPVVAVSTPPVAGNPPPVAGSTPPVAGSTPPVAGSTPPVSGTPVITPDPNHPAVNPAAPQMTSPQAPVVAVHPNATPDANYAMSATSAPAPGVQPIIINNNVDPSKFSNTGTDLINSLLAAPTSVLSSFPSILSFIPNPFKIVYGFMNTIATVYPKIQLSILVGLSTAITQIVARVLEMIASFCGIFAAIGRKRRDLSSDIIPQSVNMEQILGDLHKDIKEAVNTYVPEASPSTKKALTSGLYQNSLDTINTALVPMEQEVKKKSENTEPSAPASINYQPQSDVLSVQNMDSNYGNSRSKTDVFGFEIPGAGGIKVQNNDLPYSNTLGAQTDLYGNSDDLQKQVNQFSNDLVQAPQDIFGFSNFVSPQQNNGQQSSKNQNDIFSWNK